jgi:hypothetical protein
MKKLQKNCELVTITLKNRQKSPKIKVGVLQTPSWCSYDFNDNKINTAPWLFMAQ